MGLSVLVKDWITVAVFVVLFFTYFEHLQPFQREFRLDDSTLQHPFATVERVTDNQLYVYSTLLPTAVICIVQFFRSKAAGARTSGDNGMLSATNRTLLGLWVSVVAAACVTDVLKVWIARPRPDFLQRCGAIAGTPLHEYVTTKVCSAPLGQMYLSDGMKSTPLGHLSMSFAGLFYLTLWFGRDGKIVQLSGLNTIILRILPSLLAAYIAFSRTQDYRHHFLDITIGLVIGVLFAWGSYVKYHTASN